MSEFDEDDALVALASLARAAACAPPRPEVERGARSRLMAKVHLATRPHLRWRSVAVAMVAAAAVGAFVVLVGMPWLALRRPLSYAVKGGQTVDSAYVSAPSDAPLDVQFSDGSEVRAEAGSRLRVDSTSPDGARLLLERGSANVQIRHRTRSAWRFLAGPFEVHVTGTRFALAWDPTRERVDLTVFEGAVEVASPLGAGSLAVRAGQRYHAEIPAHSLSLEEATTEHRPGSALAPSRRSPAEFEAPAGVAPSAGTPSAGTPSAGTGVSRSAASEKGMPASPDALDAPSGPAFGGTGWRHGRAQGASAGSSRAPLPRRDSWSERCARGEYREVVEAAQARGFEACVADCDVADLRALADAARYTGRADLAQDCLLALRRRFAGSDESARAAFLMGRTSETRGQNPTAERWYDRYLAESPDGTFAADALAGKARCVAAARGVEAARPIALQYLRSYPDGVHVKTLRKIAGTD